MIAILLYTLAMLASHVTYLSNIEIWLPFYLYTLAWLNGNALVALRRSG